MNKKIESKGNFNLGQPSVITTLTLIFIVLKCTNNIDWTWWWVFSPMWIFWGAIVIIFIAAITADLGVTALEKVIGKKDEGNSKGGQR